MGTIKRITAESGEECMVDVEILHDILLKLPAEIYIELFQKMQMRIYGYHAYIGSAYCSVENQK